MSPVIVRAFEIDEQESGHYLGKITDNDGVTFLPGSTLTLLQLTLWAVKEDGSSQFINARNHQNVLNLNNVTVYDVLQVDANGHEYNLLWAIQPLDTTLVEVLPFERHLALFEWTWAQGQGKHEFELIVKNLQQVG